MGRLTIRIEATNEVDCAYCPPEYNIKGGCSVDCEMWQKRLKKLAHYEDMEEQGRLIELPCAVGDTIYEIHDGKIRTNRLVTKWRIARYLEEGFFGELVFTTKEEAEAKLKENESNRCVYCQDGRSLHGQKIMPTNYGWQAIKYCPNCGAKMGLKELEGVKE